MTAHTHGSLPLHGAVPLEARKVWARLAKSRGCAGFCLWSVGPLSRTGPLPLEDLPGCFQRPFCKQSHPLFPQAAHSSPKSGRKELWVGPLSGPLALSLGTRQGVHTSRKRQKHKLTSVPAPCTCRELACGQAAPWPPQQHCTVGRGRADLGAQWACCSPCCTEAAGPKRA